MSEPHVHGEWRLVTLSDGSERSRCGLCEWPEEIPEAEPMEAQAA